MQQKAEKNKNLILRIACILLVLVMLTTQLLCRIYASFATEDSAGDSAAAAAFAFVTQDGADSRYLDLAQIEKPGDSRTYTFTVSNASGTTVSETAEKYAFTIDVNGNMPIQCTILDKDKNPILDTGTVHSSPIKVQADAGEFKAAEGRTDTYTITVKWPEAENDAKYASRSTASEVMLTVTAQQMD